MCIAIAPQGAWPDEEAGSASSVKCPSGPLASRRHEDQDSYPSSETYCFALQSSARPISSAR
jgi:hypothetical protein